MPAIVGRKKNEHKIPRVPVQVPKPWAVLARKLASKNKQPMLWLILSLLAEEAERQKEDRPPLPWEDDGDE